MSSEAESAPADPDVPENPRLRQFLRLGLLGAGAAGAGLLLLGKVPRVGASTPILHQVFPDASVPAYAYLYPQQQATRPVGIPTGALWEDTSGIAYEYGGSRDHRFAFLHGKKVYVSSDGIANGQSDIANDGADFGPDTPGTATGGLQEAIESLRGIWGSVEFWGTITIGARLYLYPGIALRGAGPLSAFSMGSSVIKVPYTFNNPIITCVVDPNYTTNLYFPYLENFTINASGYTSSNTVQDGIRIDAVNGQIYDIYIHHVSVFNPGGNGLNLLANVGNLKAWVDDVYFEVCGQNGVLMNGGILRLNKAYVFGNVLWGIDASGGGILQVGGGTEVWNNGQGSGGVPLAAGKGGGIRVQSVGTGCIIDTATFQDCGGPNNPTIALASLGGQNAYAIIKNCKFWEGRSAALRAINHIGGTAPVHFLIEGNTFVGQGGKAISIPYDATNRGFIRNCPGYTDILGFISPNPVVGASPWTYVNEDYVDVDFDFSTSGGDTLTSITKAGQPLPLQSSTDSGLIPVHPMESLVISYVHSGGSQVARRWGF